MNVYFISNNSSINIERRGCNRNNSRGYYNKADYQSEKNKQFILRMYIKKNPMIKRLRTHDFIMSNIYTKKNRIYIIKVYENLNKNI